MRNRRAILALVLLVATSPLIAGASVAQQDVPVYGWVGTIYRYSRPSYDDYFVRNDGELFGIAGSEAAIELEIIELRNELVKVWGMLIQSAPDFNGRQIVVREILPAGVTPTATPALPATVTATVTVSVANVRTGPSINYPRVTYAYYGDTYSVVGRNENSTWYQLCCPSQQTAWIYAGLVSTEGEIATVPVVPVAPPPTPTPTPTPTPVPITDWRGEYFSNAGLQGPPALVRNDETVDFDWGSGSPAPSIPADDFSARWTRNPSFRQGNYRFYARSDDGVRLWLDDWLVIDEWRPGPLAAAEDFYNVGEGSHAVRVEYYEHLGQAYVVAWWQQIDIFQNWRGEYFDNIYLDPPPVVVRDDPTIDFNWGLGSPAPEVPSDNFSVRWTRSVYFDAGDYRFYVNGGDGVRLRLDGWLVIDNWLQDTQHSFMGRFDEVGSGFHTVEMEWYSRGGIALANLRWERITRRGGPIPD